MQYSFFLLVQGIEVPSVDTFNSKTHVVTQIGDFNARDLHDLVYAIDVMQNGAHSSLLSCVETK